MRKSKPSSSRPLALVVTGMIGFGMVACGSSDDNASSDATPPPEQATATAPESTGSSGDKGSRSVSEKQRVADVVEGMYGDLAAGDAAGVCSAMSSNSRAQIAQQVPGGSTEPPRDRTCETSMSAFLDAAARSGVIERTLGADVKTVSIDGRRATVTVSFAGGSGSVTLLKEGGSWGFAPGAVGPSS